MEVLLLNGLGGLALLGWWLAWIGWSALTAPAPLAQLADRALGLFLLTTGSLTASASVWLVVATLNLFPVAG